MGKKRRLQKEKKEARRKGTYKETKKEKKKVGEVRK